VFPDGVDVARYRLGDADEDVHRLIYDDAAWAAVAGHKARTLKSWREAVRPCSSLFLARRAQRAIGWVAGRVLDNGRGYIQTVAVATDERGEGLGRALLLHAFADLERAGAGDMSLAVVASNEAALALYRSLGLEVEREWVTVGRA
jgi:ribosomal protein S18 acetylase RimI-like enzyme